MLPPGISCGAYSVTQGSVSSISADNHSNNLGHDKVAREGHLLRNIQLPRDGPHNILAKDIRQIPPDLSEISYYRYN